MKLFILVIIITTCIPRIIANTIPNNKPLVGPYEVKHTTVKVPGLYFDWDTVDVYYPVVNNNDLSSNVSIRFISFSHGAGGGLLLLPIVYKSLLTEIASWGFVIAAHESSFMGDTKIEYTQQLSVIKYARESAASGHPIFSLANFSYGVGVAGHSMGGQATLFCSEAENAKKYGINAAVMLHAWTKNENSPTPAIPFLAFTGTTDDVAAMSMTETFYNAASPTLPRGLVEKVGAPHQEPTDYEDKKEPYNPYLQQFVAAWFKIYLHVSTRTEVNWNELIFGNESNSLCNGGDYYNGSTTMKRCEVHHGGNVSNMNYGGKEEESESNLITSGTCNVQDFGAIGNNKTDDTYAIQTTIDLCHKKYPNLATVFFPGDVHGKVYRIFSSIALVSNTTLSIGANATIYSAQSPLKRGKPLTSRCGVSYWNTTAIFCGENISNSAIIGENVFTSIIDGGGWEGWWTDKNYGQGPRLYEPMWSENLILKDVSFIHSPSWTLHPQYCNNILVEHVQILNPRFTANTDGFDPDSSTNVVLRDSFIDTGDDGISIKSSNSSRNKHIQMPSRNIHIFNTTILSRNVCIGSATFGGIYDILIEDCIIGDDKGSSPWAIKYKSHRYFPGAMINHTFRRLKFGKIAPNNYQQPDGGQAFIITLDYGEKKRNPPPACPTMCPLFQNITFEDITIQGALQAGIIHGEPNDLLKGLRFHNITFVEKPTRGWHCQYVADDFIATNVSPMLKC